MNLNFVLIWSQFCDKNELGSFDYTHIVISDKVHRLLVHRPLVTILFLVG